MLDVRSPLPLYQQLADELSDLIHSGHYAAGERIPSEHELAERYAIGRPTVRQATEVLVRRKVLIRRRGAGTFVNEAPEVDLFSLGGTLDSFRRSGVALETRLLKPLKRRRVSADAEHPFAGARPFSLERLSKVRTRPVLLERIFLDAQVFPGLEASLDGDGSLSRVIEHRHGLRPIGGRQTFKVYSPEPRLAAQLKVANGVSLLRVERTLDFAGAPSAVFAELYCHTDELVFAQDLGDFTHA